MNGRIVGPERIPEPKEINAALAALYGYNRFGGALYRLVWGATETMQVRGMDGRYTDKVVGNNVPAWLLQRWCAPEMFWTPELYYEMSCDENGLSVTGEYPQFGRYDTIIMFVERKMVDNELVIETIPLSYQLLEEMIPLLQSTDNLTMAQLEERNKEMEARENADKVALISQRLEEEMPAFFGPVSYAGQRNHTGSAFTRKVEQKKQQIAAEWSKRRVEERRPNPMRGIFQEPI